MENTSIVKWYCNICMLLVTKTFVCSPPSSIIETVTWWGPPTETLLGSVEELIARKKCSDGSIILSAIIETLNSTMYSPAGIVTAYGPDI